MSKLRVAILAPIAWRTPPRAYGPWELVASNIAEGLVAKGVDVTLFATADSVTSGRLLATVPKGYAEDPNADPKVLEYQHISFVMERAGEFDLIHNHFDFMPLAFSRLIDTPILTTIHGFSSPKIIPLYERFNDVGHYVSISDADRSDRLRYVATVYNGIDESLFTFSNQPEDYLLYFGRIHPDKGAHEAIEIARRSGRRLLIAGLVQDERYFAEQVQPHIDGENIIYKGNVGPEARNELLGKAYALLHPISFAEPFGLSVAEAMYCGTPVIAYPLGSMSELIVDGKTGFLVRHVAEAVAAVRRLTDIDRGACHEHAKARFTQERMVGDYLRVYESIIYSS